NFSVAWGVFLMQFLYIPLTKVSDKFSLLHTQTGWHCLFDELVPSTILQLSENIFLRYITILYTMQGLDSM
ncbi:MAG: hypothetical protein ACRD80_02395, partial [Nitrososphaeraceae archaeon]